VASEPDQVERILGCIGLHIRLLGETHDCWTTTTHAWVKLPRIGRKKRVTLGNVAADVVTFIRKKVEVLPIAWKVFRTAAAACMVDEALGTRVYVARDQLEVNNVSPKAIPTS
jgi:hypothetical protein